MNSIILTALKRNNEGLVIDLAKQLPDTYTHAEEAQQWQVIKTANYQRPMSRIEQAIEKLIGNGIVPLEIALNS